MEMDSVIMMVPAFVFLDLQVQTVPCVIRLLASNV